VERIELPAVQDRGLSEGAGRATIRRYDLRFALDTQGDAPGAGLRHRYEAAQGIVFALLRQADSVATTALHDANERKALSVGPVAVRSLAGGLARAELRLGAWEPRLVELIDAALESAVEAPLDLGGAPAVLLDWEAAGSWTVGEFLGMPAPATVRVRFVSPTRFGFGRHPNGTTRAHLVPDPGPVVASWLRAWRLTGDRSLDWLPSSPEELGQAVALVEMRDMRTVTVAERTAALTGFVGECAYRWEGRETEGRQALATLARFAGVCGTGAKTGRGFGQTEPIGLVPAPR